jgi:hypothetical protein
MGETVRALLAIFLCRAFACFCRRRTRPKPRPFTEDEIARIDEAAWIGAERERKARAEDS